MKGDEWNHPESSPQQITGNYSELGARKSRETVREESSSAAPAGIPVKSVLRWEGWEERVEETVI